MLDAALCLGIDMLELGVAIGVLRAFDRLVRRLQAVAVLAQQLGHRLVADSNAVPREQLGRQGVRALAGPAQGRFGIATRDRIDELLESGPPLGLASSNGRFPWLRRTLTTSSRRAPARTSSRPVRTVLIASFVTRATCATPPRPIASASAPAHSGRPRSSSVASNRRHFWRTSGSAPTAERRSRQLDPVDPHSSLTGQKIDRLLHSRPVAPRVRDGAGDQGLLGTSRALSSRGPGVTLPSQYLPKGGGDALRLVSHAPARRGGDGVTATGVTASASENHRAGAARGRLA